MTCCGKRLPPDNTLDFTWLGCPCDTWAHLKDQFIFLADERAGVIPCKPDQFKVQWTGIDAMTYMIAVTDNLTGELCEYSVSKEYSHESPMDAFARDYRQKELRYNRGIRRAVDDTLEAFEDLHPDIRYKLSEDHKGFKIHRPIQRELGVVVWKIDYGVRSHIMPISNEEWQQETPDNVIEIPDILPEIAQALVVLLKRMRKIGIKFEDIVTETLGDFRKITINGVAYRNNVSTSTIKIVYQEMDLDKQTLNAYHEYYTDKGPQNGIYNC
ncbi:virion structural protein [Pseudomonas phage Phabio]|uniref:Virion structural protein n=1 Tax=Pseudomonas phage Phabio TaxID=2006668 RepID=A0A1Y0SYD3_9CAUD|nr:virion structural protein [Pseudomonas phage Phabio]ARV76666.1 virion structural protein [Pseudomonas phage Phabio]